MKNSLSLTGLFSFLSLLFLSACQKPEQTIGSDLLPADDELSAFQTDTITILCSVEKEDSVRMDELSSALLGSYSDPVFGRTKASLCTQIRLSSSSADFPENFEIDSVVLSLVYANHDYYGTLHPQYFSVYEMSEDLSVDSVYYSNRQPHHTGDNLILPGKEVYEIHPDEKVPVAGDTLIPQLRLQLSTETGQKLLAPSDPSVLNSDANFRTYFKGLYIDPIYWNAAIVNYNLADPGSKLTVYYRDLDNTEPDTTRYDFVITSDCARYSYMSHDYAG
ncbi:MAG: DUF4270 family protein, partial [Crocinitomicaceae bacterium]|nr:DUF4270 family protein [Crocinitomicaceae bacterium]